MIRRTCLLTLYLCAAAVLLSPAAQGQGDTTTFGRATFKLGTAWDTERGEVSIPLAFTHGAYKGMVRPETRRGEICIIPLSPLITGTLEMPRELKWSRARIDYYPNPFTVRAIVKNEGGDAAQAARFKIDYDPADYILLSPISAWQPGTPYNVDVNQTSEASWLLRARPRLTGDSVEIAVTAIFDNHPDVVLHQKMWIPPTEPILLCSINPVQITADYANNRYTPMPFDLTVSVQNAGPMATDTVYGRIELPPALKLAGTDAPGQTIKKAEPGVLRQYETGTISWALSCPMYERDTSFIVQVWVRTDNADSSLCEAFVHLPAMGKPSLRTSDRCPAELTFNETTGEYEPNPFYVSVTAVNLANTPADSVTAFLYLPEGIVLDPPDQPLRQSFGTLEKWTTGDPIPQKYLRVRRDVILPYPTWVIFKWAIGGVSSLSGLPMDTIYGFSETDIPGVSSRVECTLYAPDTIRPTLAGGLEPNPFTVVYTIKNTGFSIGRLMQAVCYFPNDGIALSPAVPGNTQTRDGYITLNPGDSTTYEWTFDVAGRITARNLQIQVVAFDDEGNPIPCENIIYIEGTPTSVDGPLALAPTFALAQNYPNPFSSSTDIAYSVGAESEVSLTVHNILGKRVAVLAEGRKAAGQYAARFEAKDLPGGVYVVRMKAPHFSQSRLILLHR